MILGVYHSRHGRANAHMPACRAWWGCPSARPVALVAAHVGSASGQAPWARSRRRRGTIMHAYAHAQPNWAWCRHAPGVVLRPRRPHWRPPPCTGAPTHMGGAVGGAFRRWLGQGPHRLEATARHSPKSRGGGEAGLGLAVFPTPSLALVRPLGVWPGAAMTMARRRRWRRGRARRSSHEASASGPAFRAPCKGATESRRLHGS